MSSRNAQLNYMFFETIDNAFENLLFDENGEYDDIFDAYDIRDSFFEFISSFMYKYRKFLVYIIILLIFFLYIF